MSRLDTYTFLFSENKSFLTGNSTAKGVQISAKSRDSADHRLSVRVLQKSFELESHFRCTYWDCWGFLEPSRPEPGPGPGPVQTCPREKTLQSLSLSSERFIPQYLLPSLGMKGSVHSLCHVCSFPAKISSKPKSLHWSEVYTMLNNKPRSSTSLVL